MGIPLTRLSGDDTSSPNPNPLSWVCEAVCGFKHCTVMIVTYVGVTSYEGRKVLIIKGSFPDINAFVNRYGWALDPHFSEPSEDRATVLARYAPTEHGVRLAMQSASIIDAMEES